MDEKNDNQLSHERVQVPCLNYRVLGKFFTPYVTGVILCRYQYVFHWTKLVSLQKTGTIHTVVISTVVLTACECSAQVLCGQMPFGITSAPYLPWMSTCLWREGSLLDASSHNHKIRESASFLSVLNVFEVPSWSNGKTVGQWKGMARLMQILKNTNWSMVPKGSFSYETIFLPLLILDSYLVIW